MDLLALKGADPGQALGRGRDTWAPRRPARKSARPGPSALGEGRPGTQGQDKAGKGPRSPSDMVPGGAGGHGKRGERQRQRARPDRHRRLRAPPPGLPSRAHLVDGRLRAHLPQVKSTQEHKAKHRARASPSVAKKVETLIVSPPPRRGHVIASAQWERPAEVLTPGLRHRSLPQRVGVDSLREPPPRGGGGRGQGGEPRACPPHRPALRKESPRALPARAEGGSGCSRSGSTPAARSGVRRAVRGRPDLVCREPPGRGGAGCGRLAPGSRRGAPCTCARRGLRSAAAPTASLLSPESGFATEKATRIDLPRGHRHAEMSVPTRVAVLVLSGTCQTQRRETTSY